MATFTTISKQELLYIEAILNSMTSPKIKDVVIRLEAFLKQTFTIGLEVAKIAIVSNDFTNDEKEQIKRELKNYLQAKYVVTKILNSKHKNATNDYVNFHKIVGLIKTSLGIV